MTYRSPFGVLVKDFAVRQLSDISHLDSAARLGDWTTSHCVIFDDRPCGQGDLFLCASTEDDADASGDT